MSREDGFTLVETLIAMAIGTIVIVALALAVNRFVFAAASADTRLQTQMSADHTLERLTSEAASAWAVYVPPTDVFGSNNQDGHEVDFLSEDGSHRTYSWAYTYDATTKHLTRYSFAAGPQLQKDEDLGAFDAFSATNVPANQLGSVDPLFASSTIPSITYGYDSAPGASGGNSMVRIAMSALGANRSELLASSTTPTTFTVVVNYTPSPAPVATATPTPLGVVAGATATPFPTPTPCVIGCTPTPIPTATPPLPPTPPLTPTPCPTNCTPPLPASFSDVKCNSLNQQGDPSCSIVDYQGGNSDPALVPCDVTNSGVGPISATDNSGSIFVEQAANSQGQYQTTTSTIFVITSGCQTLAAWHASGVF